MSNFDSAQPLVSIVMPTYNHDAFIGEAIESVLQQSYKRFELIIIDNYSEDKTEEIVHSYQSRDGRILYHKFHNNGIIASSRNEGIRISNGEYIAFLDSDDSWLPEKLERVISVFKHDPSIDLVCHDEYHVDNDGKVLKKKRMGPYKEYKDLLLKGNCLSTSTVVVKKKKVIEAGFFSIEKAFVTVEDYELWLRLSRISKIEYLHETLANWRIHITSHSGNVEKNIQNVLNVLNHHFSMFPHKSFYYEYLKRKRRSGVIRALGNYFLKEGDFRSARKHLLSAVRLDPFSIKTLILSCTSLLFR